MAAVLKEDVQQSFKQTFSVFDRDQSGEIDCVDFPTAVRSLGYNPTNGQVEEVLRAANKSEKDKINFDEFADMLGKFDSSSKDEAEESLREAFKWVCKSNSCFFFSQVSKYFFNFDLHADLVFYCCKINCIDKLAVLQRAFFSADYSTQQ